MKSMIKIKVSPFNILLFALGIAIIVAGILLLALRPNINWQGDVIIGVLMAVSVWAMFNIPMEVSTVREPVERERE